MPHLILLASPNGAGKTTAAEDLLVGAFQVTEFVNADEIARGISRFNPEGVSIEAGRVMLRRLRHLTEQRKDVAFESTLASRSFAPWIRELRAGDYVFHLLFFWLPQPEISIERVRHRKLLGGHTVPEDVIRRRFNAGLHNFFHLYRPIADTWRFYDNSAGWSPPAYWTIPNPCLVPRSGIQSKRRCGMLTDGAQVTRSITDIILEGTEVEAALDRAFYRAVLRHRRGGVSMVFWRDGKIVDVDANDIPIPEDILREIS